jgi:FlaA1/EpsC-like NDP-sugar epimerase
VLLLVLSILYTAVCAVCSLAYCASVKSVSIAFWVWHHINMIMIMMHRVLLVLVVGASAFVPMIMATKVLVTGAGGKTGSLVFKKLLQRPEYEPVGLVRTEKVSDR